MEAMETLVLNGTTYVKASTAARALGYTADYVGQLCRKGAVDAQLVGRSWYVNQEELASHRTEKKRSSRAKAREQVKLAIKEQTEARSTGSSKHFEGRSIRYEPDTEDLIPQVKKLTIASEVSEGAQKAKAKTRSAAKRAAYASGKGNYTVENEGKKVQMSGTLEVVDVTDEEFVGEDTVLLEASVRKGGITPISESKKLKPKATTIEDAPLEQPKESTAQDSPANQASDFYEKLAQLEVEGVTGAQEGIEDVQVAETEQPTKTPTKRSYWGTLLVFLSLIIAGCLVTLQSVWTTSPSEGVEVELQTSFEFSIEAIKNIEK